jgi:hypothetical protein
LRSWVKVALVTALFAVPAMALGQVIWPLAPGSPEPTAGQLPFFLFLAVFEALTFGLGISFLVSWWPHNNLHTHNGWICRVSSTSSTAST